MNKLVFSLVLTNSILFTSVANAMMIDFERVEYQDYSVKGSFSYNSNMHGKGAINQDDLDTFTFEGFYQGASMGSWSMADGVSQFSRLFNFNFDTSTMTFLYGGDYSAYDPLHLNWGDTTSGISMIGGDASNGVGVDGTWNAWISASDGGAQFTARVRQSQAIPEPTSIALMGLGLLGLGFARNLRPN